MTNVGLSNFRYGLMESTQPEEKGWTVRITLICVIACLQVPAVAYSLACLNAPSKLIKEFMNATEVERTGVPMDESTQDSNFGLLVSVVGLGAIVTGLTSSAISDRIGRKRAIFVAGVTGGVGILMTSLAETASAYEMLFVGRTFIGFGVGWSMSQGPTYVMELCQPNMKGAGALGNQFGQSIVFIFAQVLGYEELLGNSKCWNYLLGLPLIFIVVQFILFPFCPESPRYLLFKKREKEAEEALQKIYGVTNVDYYLHQLEQEQRDSATERQVSILGLVRTKVLRRPLMITVAMGLNQNWCGMNAIMFFSAELFTDVGVPEKASRYATSCTGLIFFLGNILGTFLLTRFGRKTLFIGGTAGMGICCAVLPFTMLYKDEVDALKYVNVAVSLLIIAFYSLGPIVAYLIIIGELFPHSARGSAFSVGILCAMTGFFSHCFALPSMLETMGSYAFFVFTGLDLVTVVYLFIYLPETKGKTFQQVASTWAEPGELDSKDSMPMEQEITPSSSATTQPHHDDPLNTDGRALLDEGNSDRPLQDVV